MNIILFDTTTEHGNLLPLTFTRPIADLRVGINTLREKWEALLPGNYSYQTESYLSEKYPCRLAEDNIFIAGHLLATQGLANQIANLETGEAIADEARPTPQKQLPLVRPPMQYASPTTYLAKTARNCVPISSALPTTAPRHL